MIGVRVGHDFDHFLYVVDNDKLLLGVTSSFIFSNSLTTSL